MTSKLKCPICGGDIQYDNSYSTYDCQNNPSEHNASEEVWQALIQSQKDRKELAIKLAQTNQDLEQSEKCCSAWETQALDYKAETIALSGKLKIATKALEEIDTTRCIPQQTLISLGKRSKTTRFNAGNIICVATPDYIHNTLEQIEHIADTSKMIEHKE